MRDACPGGSSHSGTPERGREERAWPATASEHVLEQVELAQVGAFVVHRVAAQVGEPAARVEGAGRNVLDIGIQPDRAAEIGRASCRERAKSEGSRAGLTR